MEEIKKVYTKPETKEEALKTIESQSTEVYSRLKGRGLGLIEKWFPEKVQQQSARDSYLLLLSTVSNSLTRKLTDCVEILKGE